MDEKKYDADVAITPAQAEGGKHNTQVYGDEIQKGLKRGLKPRHVSVSRDGVASGGAMLGLVLDRPYPH